MTEPQTPAPSGTDSPVQPKNVARTRFAEPGSPASAEQAAPAAAGPETTAAPDTAAASDSGATPQAAAPVIEPAPADATTDTATTDTATADTAAAGERAWLIPTLAGLTAALAVLVAVLSFSVMRASGPGQVDDSRRAALGTARTAARVIFSYDYRHLTKDFAAGKAATTGAFNGEYVRTTGKLVTDVAPRYKAVVVSDVSGAAVVSASSKSVVALVFVNQQSSSSLMTTPKVTQSRLEMTLVKHDGRWLVSKVRAL